jgi:uncharacterized protein CbrC (UPF0167 family)
MKSGLIRSFTETRFRGSQSSRRPDVDLPVFRYHPDPISTGSIVKSDAGCRCCGQKRGYVYDGAPYGEEELENCICPWCIADGSAHKKFDVTFVDEDGIGGYGRWDEVSGKVIREVACRTPGFHGWQQEEWWTHCGDAAAFVGSAGAKELSAYGTQLEESLRDYSETGDEEEWQEALASLDKDAGPTAYVFRCLHCGAMGGYWDAP